MKDNTFPKGLRQMAIKITKPPGTACGTYLPHKSEIGPSKPYKNPPYYYQSDYAKNQREQLIPAGTCFQVTKKEKVTNNEEKEFEIDLKCLDPRIGNDKKCILLRRLKVAILRFPLANSCGRLL
jgi:hypothetical protein